MSRRRKVLLSEGSSLSARHTLSALGPRGYVIDVCDPQPLTCLARFSRFVRAVYRCPPFAADPAGYLQFLAGRLKAERYDVLLPVHDQAYLLARFRETIVRHVGLALPTFVAMETLQGKAEFVRLLRQLNIPHPPTAILESPRDLESVRDFPCYVKLAHSTAGCGVWQVQNLRELKDVAERLEPTQPGEVLVQRPAPGPLCVVQSVFQRGRLVAAHCYRARAQGVGGSAWAREGVFHPTVLDHLVKLGGHLGWHGALFLDYCFDPAAGPAYIDANPRIGETMNATLSGVNLCDLLVRVSLGEEIREVAPPQPGVRTHSVMMSLMALAQQGKSRGRLLAEWGKARLGRSLYADSQDELTRPRDDPPSILPAAYLASRFLIDPKSADRIVRHTVENYSLTSKAVQAIRGLPDNLFDELIGEAAVHPELAKPQAAG